MSRLNLTRASLLGAVLIAMLAASAAVAVAQAPGRSARIAHSATVQLRRTRLGMILVNSSGRTLYVFTRDHNRSNSCIAISNCPQSWPALQTTVKPTAGAGVNPSLLSTITITGGKQVTYAGHALYLYSGDSGPAETEYVGARQFGGTWDALTATAHLIR
jgi:predicted lipoprotein with Yx(FWY)xxD motif